MDNNFEQDENINNSASMQEETFEVKESLLDKIKSAFSRQKLLGSGSNVKTTNMSFNSWSIRASFRRALENVSSSISNMMRGKQPEVKNGFATTVIGREDNSLSQENVKESEPNQTVARIIPPIKVPVKPAAVQVQAQAKGIINNAVSAKMEAEANIEEMGATDGLSVETLDIDKSALKGEKTQDVSQTSKQAPQSIDIGNINVGQPAKDTLDKENGVEK